MSTPSGSSTPTEDVKPSANRVTADREKSAAFEKGRNLWEMFCGLNWKKKALIVVGVLAIIGNLSTYPSQRNTDSGSPTNLSQGSTDGGSSTKGVKAAAAQTEKSEPPVDKDSLKLSISQSESVTADAYTPESYQVLTGALEGARQVVADEKSTQSAVDAAKRELDNAYSGLKEAFNPNNYSWPAYRDVARTPDAYKDQKVAFTGRVLQVVEDSSENKLRVATDGSWDDVIMVGYAPDLLGETHILQDDTVTVYGTCVGQFTYSTALGSQMSIPGVFADQITIG